MEKDNYSDYEKGIKTKELIVILKLTAEELSKGRSIEQIETKNWEIVIRAK